MDETSVAAFHGCQNGNVMMYNKADEEPIQWATRGKRRTCFTHCAFICNNLQAQKKLPQLLLVNEHTVTIPQYESLLARRPWNVYIKRLKSAWNTEEITAVLVGVLKEHLQEFLAEYEIILFMDAARVHCGRKVILASNRHGIGLLILPAKLTWLLQPCDTHLFVVYKRYMRQRWQEVAQLEDDGVVNIDTLFDIVFETIDTIMNSRSWDLAFKENGFHNNFGRLSKFIMKRLEYTSKPNVNTAMPTLETFTWCFPGRTIIPENLLIKQLQPAAPLSLPAPMHVAQLALGPPEQQALPAPAAAQGAEEARGARLVPRRDRVREALSTAPQQPQWATQLMQMGAGESQPPEEPTHGRTLPWQLRSQSSRPDGTQ